MVNGCYPPLFFRLLCVAHYLFFHKWLFSPSVILHLLYLRRRFVYYMEWVNVTERGSLDPRLLDGEFVWLCWLLGMVV